MKQLNHRKKVIEQMRRQKKNILVKHFIFIFNY